MKRCFVCDGNYILKEYYHKKGIGYICLQCGRSDDAEYESYVIAEKSKNHRNWKSYYEDHVYYIKGLLEE